MCLRILSETISQISGKSLTSLAFALGEADVFRLLFRHVVARNQPTRSHCVNDVPEAGGIKYVTVKISNIKTGTEESLEARLLHAMLTSTSLELFFQGETRQNKKLYNVLAQSIYLDELTLRFYRLFPCNCCLV